MINVQQKIPRLSKPQRDLLKWTKKDSLGVCGLLSAAWGSGKTYGAAIKFVYEVLKIPKWEPESGKRQPLAIVLTPTFPNLMSNTLPMLTSLFPPGTIVKRRVSPVRYWETRNGVRIIFSSGDGYVDSVTADIIWVDEVTQPCFLDEYKWSIILARFRGTGLLIVSGIASNIPVVRQRFDLPDGIFMPGLKDNPSLNEEAIQNALKFIPSHNRDAAYHGGWLPTQDNIYNLDPDLHTYSGPVNRSLPCHIGIDPGDQACALVLQKLNGMWVIVDEFHLNSVDAEGLCNTILLAGWNPITCSIDAQASIDTIQAIRRVMPNIHILQKPKRSAQWYVEHGIERVQWALQDANGTVRLQIHQNLWTHPKHPDRNLVHSMGNYRRGANYKPVRNNRTDHVLDALRYLVVDNIHHEDVATTNMKPQTFRMY